MIMSFRVKGETILRPTNKAFVPSSVIADHRFLALHNTFRLLLQVCILPYSSHCFPLQCLLQTRLYSLSCQFFERITDSSGELDVAGLAASTLDIRTIPTRSVPLEPERHLPSPHLNVGARLIRDGNRSPSNWKSESIMLN